MKIKLAQKSLLIIVIVIFIVIIGWFISKYFVNQVNDLDKFARCLTEKDATVYVSKICGACKSQKGMFGDSFKYVNSVECTENQELCQQMGIREVPTWIINGASYNGVQDLETLSSLTDCPLE